MKILVTGSGTIIGNNVCQELIKKKHKVIAAYRNTKPENLKLKKISFDLKKNIKFNFKFDCLVHCASAIPSYNLSKEEIFKTNNVGFRKILNEAKRCNCKKIVLISTSSIFGEPEVSLDENYIPKPKENYGKSKLIMEKDLIKFCTTNNFNYKIFRLSNLIGKNSKFNFLSKCLYKIKNNQKLFFSNPNLKFNNLTHIDNLKKIIAEAIQNEKNEIFNLCTKNPIKLINVIKFMYKLANKDENFSVKYLNSKKGYNIKLSNKLRTKYEIYSTKYALKRFVIQNK